MSYKRLITKKYESESELIREVFSPLINFKIRTLIRCSSGEDMVKILHILTDFYLFYNESNLKNESTIVLEIRAELQKQAENFVNISIERGVLCNQ
jgi:hypothetical protein